MQNKFAVCDWVFPKPGVAAIEQAGKLGYQGIQLVDLGAKYDFPLNKPEVQQALLEASQRCGVEMIMLNISSISYDNKILHPMGTRESAAIIETFEKDIDAAVALGIKEAFIGAFYGSSIRTDADMRCYAAHLRHAGLYAKDKGVNLSFECLMTVEEIRRMQEYVGLDFTILYDSCNPILNHTSDPLVDVKLLGKDGICSQVHLKNISADHNTEESRFALNTISLVDWAELENGIYDIPAFCKALKETGFTGWLVNENFHNVSHRDDEETILRLLGNDLAYMKKLFNW